MILLYSNHSTTAQCWENNCLDEKPFVFNCEESLTAFLNSLHVKNIIVIDERLYSLKDMEEFLSFLKGTYPLSLPIVLSPIPSFSRGLLLLKYGIRAYGNSYMAPIHFQEMLVCVQKGDVWLYPQFIQTMISTLRLQKDPSKDEVILTRLSPKEQEVANLIKKGLSNKEIASYLNVTERTVKAHLSSIYEKTGAKDRLALAVLI